MEPKIGVRKLCGNYLVALLRIFADMDILLTWQGICKIKVQKVTVQDPRSDRMHTFGFTYTQGWELACDWAGVTEEQGAISRSARAWGSSNGLKSR